MNPVSGSSTVQHALQTRCITCGAVEDSPAADFRCTHCGELLEITYPAWTETGIDARALKQLWDARRSSRAAVDRSGVWRYRELLPILSDLNNAVTIQEGNTPIYDLPRCAHSAGVDRLLAKHQGMNPTGSFKDTGMTAALSVAKEKRFDWVACASTGNTSASMSAYAARAGMKSLVLIPEGKIAWGKLSQALDYGAVTCQLRGDFDACMRVIAEVVRRAPVYLLNSVNPYRVEGQKTAAIEMLDQLGWQVPDHVIVPGGNLGNVSALGKGFLELRELGFVNAVPKISVIQAAGANALVRTMRETGGTRLVPVQAETLATAIRIGNPASWRKAVAVLRASDGACEQVSEEELAIAKAEIGSDGVGCEPASAATLAGLKKLVRFGFVKRGESVVLILTGHLLKDPEYTLKFHRGDLFDNASGSSPSPLRRPPILLDANPEAVLRVLDRA
ncbi:MAG: threonine synthase [Acidobacteria bacterium]|nr:threonine synthase [Acidobacteriota bacterium]